MPRFDRRRLALGVTPLLAVLALGLVIVAGEVPVGRRRAAPPGRSRAAVALRDHVIPFQKWGTKLFTVPHLEEVYDDVTYLTAAAGPPAHAELMEALARALAAHDDVDLFLLAHGNRMVDWIEELDPALRKKLRLVYNTGCGNAHQADQWLALGADAYVGHAAPLSMSPVFYVYFLRRWVRGWSLEEAVGAANRASARRLDWFGVGGSLQDATAGLFGRADLWVGGGS